METHVGFESLDRRPATGRNLLLLGLWLRSIFVGAAFAVGGIASLLDAPHDLPVLTAVTWIAAGGTFAWLAWQRATALFERFDADEPAPPDHDRASRIPPVTRVSASS